VEALGKDGNVLGRSENVTVLQPSGGKCVAMPKENTKWWYKHKFFTTKHAPKLCFQ